MLFTVFTPTYNREHTLPRVFACLKAQTLRDFEWVVVDDGSTDGTAELFQRWAREAAFPVHYIVQTNAGKHVAFNRGVDAARGNLVAPLDSDDECLPEALERMARHWYSIPEAERVRYAGVAGLCVGEDGHVFGDRFPQDVMDSDGLEMYYRHRVRGEKWGCIRRDVLREHRFPTPPGVRFIPEGIVWNAISSQYRTRYFNEPLRIYHHDTPGGQLSGADPARHSVGMAFWHLSVLNDRIAWFPHAPVEFYRSALHFVRFSLHAGDGPAAQFARLRGPGAVALWLAALPPGVAVYLRDRSRCPAVKRD